MRDPDHVTDTKTIYQVSPWEIFWRNIIAGMGRAVGGFLISAVVLVIVGQVLAQTVWPAVQPMISSLQTSLETLEDISTFGQRFPAR